jgi:RND family efflux transporter MFP subunit
VAAALLLATAVLPSAGTRAEATFDCVMDPALVVRLGSSVTGLIDRVTVDRGDPVRVGQPVATIVSDLEKATVDLARARAGSRAEIEAQEARLALSRKRLERAGKLARGDIVTDQKMDELEAEVAVTERELHQAKLQKVLAELDLARAEVAVAQRTIRSPIDGIVSRRLLSAGEYVHQEVHILALAQLDPLHVEVFLPVRLYDHVREGTIGRVHPDEPIGGTYAARVTVIDRVFDAASGTFGVRLELPNPEQRLPAGQRCRVSFDAVPGTG